MTPQEIADRHNADLAKAPDAPKAGHNSQAQMKSIVERVEKLEEEKKAIADDIKDVYSEAKANGFDVKALRKIVSLRKQDPKKREEEEAVLDAYKAAMGMLD